MLNKMVKLRNKKGFTLMEMLIVVAIIAILIAIAIPTFNSAMNKAKVGTDEANIRSGYAAVMTEVLTNDVADGTAYGLNSDGSVKKAATGTYTCQGKPAEAVQISGQSVAAWDNGHHVTYTYSAATDTAAAKVTITTAKAS